MRNCGFKPLEQNSPAFVRVSQRPSAAKYMAFATSFFRLRVGGVEGREVLRSEISTGTIFFIGGSNKSHKNRTFYHSGDIRRNIMARKPGSPPMIRSLVVLFFLIMAGKTPIDAGSGLRPATPRDPIILGDPAMEPRLIQRFSPVYPELAKKARVSGKVILILNIDEEGNVTEIKLQSGHPFLNDAAINAVKIWKYTPTVLQGEPVPVMATVNVIFKLDKPGGSRIDLDLADTIMRHKARQSISDKPFIREGNANLELMMEGKTPDATSKLKSAGFEIIRWPEGSKKAIGRIAIAKLELLLNIDAVQYIAPHLP
jgi:TonB family protein